MSLSVLLAKQFWILDPLYTALGTVLAWFYALIPNYGVAIVLLTVAVRLLTFPLTAKQAKAQQALQKVQPELKRLQAKYKNDKQKLNEEMMKFYKENHVNPFGSCLPLIIQAPILIVLYRLIIGLTGSVIIGFTIVVIAVTGPLAGGSVHGGHIKGGALSEQGVVTKGTLEGAEVLVDGKVVGTVVDAKVVNGKIPSAQVVNGAAPVATLTDLTVQGGKLVGDPKHVPTDSKLQKALVKSGGTMDSFGMDLSKAAAKVTDTSVIPYFILILAVMATGYYQQRQLTARQPKNGGNPQMQAIGKIFPVMFGVISYTIPAGVVVYFLVSNLWQIGQQAFIFRNQELPPASSEPKKAGSSKPGDGSAKTKAKGAGAKATTKGRGAGRAGTSGRERGAGTSGRARGAGASSARSDSKGGRRGTRPPARGAQSKDQQRKAADRRRAAPKSIPPKQTPREDTT